MIGKRVYLSLGSNLGERQQNLRSALAALEREKIRVLTESSIYESEPQDAPGQPWFLNMVAECETACFPLQLLSILQRIEGEFGRVRNAKLTKRPRTVDIDILLFGNVSMDTLQLAIPHPRMLQRRFVLEPLLEIAPKLRDPRTSQLLSGYFGNVAGQIVRKISGQPLND